MAALDGNLFAGTRPPRCPKLLRRGPVSGLASDNLLASRPSPSRELRSGLMMVLDSLTVAGAAPVLRGALIPRTGFPFNPDAKTPPGTQVAVRIATLK